jgi:hypothetical protein
MKKIVITMIIISVIFLAASCSQPEADGTLTVIVTGTANGEDYTALANNGIVVASSDLITASGSSITLPLFSFDALSGGITTTKQVFTGGTLVAFTVQEFGDINAYDGLVTIDGDMTVTVSRSGF